MFFDTHLHLINPDSLDYPWLADVELLNRPSTYEDYRQKAGRLGITACLHMEVDVAEDQIRDETVMIEEVAALENSLIQGCISACRPEHEDFAVFLQWVKEKPLIRGFRRVLHVVPDDVSQSQLFRDNVARLSGTGFTFDLCVLPHQHRIAGELVDYCPEVSFILDHCGVPDIRDGEFSPWAASISELAKRPNLTAKISGIIAYADPENWTIGDLRPWFEHVVSAFGHERIVWGSDSPVCNLGGGLEGWTCATHALTEGWTNSERRDFYRHNAQRLWRLPLSA